MKRLGLKVQLAYNKWYLNKLKNNYYIVSNKQAVSKMIVEQNNIIKNITERIDEDNNSQRKLKQF